MILATIYFIVFCFIIKESSFFKDNAVTFKLLLAILLIKSLACFVYYWVYFDHYSGSLLSDSESTMNGAKIIYGALPGHVGDYLNIIFGFHSESPADPLYETYFKAIDKWETVGNHNEFLLNDNRTITRINAVIMLFSFGSYAVHGFFMAMFSFLGQWAFYKTFKNYFIGKEILFALVVFLTPSVLFWTSGVLKEPIAVCLLGLFCYSFFQIFVYRQGKSLNAILLLFFSSIMFLVLKPYVLMLVLLPLLCFVIVQRFQIRKVFWFYFLSLILLFSGSLFVFKYVFHKDVVQVIVNRQNDFINLSKGGTFFKNEKRYVRLEYQDSLAVKDYELVDSSKKLYRIKPHVTLMYWNEPNLNWDTVFVNDNQDTTLYRFISSSAQAGSSIQTERLSSSFSSFLKMIPKSFYHVLCKPFFFDARGTLDLLASLENLLFLALIIFCVLYRNSHSLSPNILWMCTFIVIISFLLIGLTTTVLGAIVRYKVPFLPFLWMIPLLYLDPEKWKKAPVINRFFRDKS